MTTVRRALPYLLLALAGCDSGSTAELAVRGERYCEVLLATSDGTNLHVDVYNSVGLNDCPADAWAALDAGTIAADHGATFAVLNGPRYWLIDSFGDSQLLDSKQVDFGGIAMRKAGMIDVPVSEVPMLRAIYTQHTIERFTGFVFAAGSTVYELVDPAGHVYTMQSYSAQVVPQTEADLATLGATLMLPSGWSYRSRVLDADLVVRSTNGTATVVQDEREDTYLLTM